MTREEAYEYVAEQLKKEDILFVPEDLEKTVYLVMEYIYMKARDQSGSTA